MGSSPRGSLALLLTARAYAVVRGRDYVTPDDVKAVAHAALDHRVTVRPELWMNEVTSATVIESVLSATAAPGAAAAARHRPTPGRELLAAPRLRRPPRTSRRSGPPGARPPPTPVPLWPGSGWSAFGVLLRRPELLVLGTPLLLVALWGMLTRPEADPVVAAGPRHLTLREGQATRWVAEVQPVQGVEDLGLVLMPDVSPSTTRIRAPSPPRHWGRSRAWRWGAGACAGAGGELGPAVLSVSGPLGAYRWAPDVVTARPVSTVPLPDHFDARVPVPRPDGLVGQNRSSPPGRRRRVRRHPSLPLRRPAATRPLAGQRPHR